MAEDNKPGEIIRPPNNLKKKIGGKMPEVDPHAIAAAEAALASLSNNFEDWIKAEVNKLETAYKATWKDGMGSSAGKELYNTAHDLKGLGTTYGYPIVTQMADTLCAITITQELRDKAPEFLLNAHVQAIHAAVKTGIKDTSHPAGNELVKELRNKVTTFLNEVETA